MAASKAWRDGRSSAPVAHGGLLGLLPGAGLGASCWVLLWAWADILNDVDQSPTSAADIWAILPFVLFAGVVGGIYGSIVGAISGLGAVAIPTPGRQQRIVVTVIAVAVGLLTAGLLAAWSGDASWLVVPMAVYLPVMGLIAYALAPRLYGDRDWYQDQRK